MFVWSGIKADIDYGLVRHWASVDGPKRAADFVGGIQPNPILMLGPYVGGIARTPISMSRPLTIMCAVLQLGTSGYIYTERGDMISTVSLGFAFYMSALYVAYTPYGIAEYKSATPLVRGVWSHIAVTNNATVTVKFYINGRLDVTRTTSGYLGASQDPGILHGGRSAVGYPTPSIGGGVLGVHDLRIYNRELQIGEIAALSNMALRFVREPYKPFRAYSIPASVGLYRRVGMDGGMIDLCAGLRG